ncbi:MAG: iron-containing alcohol dehydrogenase [Arenicella sp.]|nr:iron-containing alcohol dehydrogenase [Arenicella sp.]
MLSTLPTTQWNYPTSIQVGSGQIDYLSESCKKLGMTAPLLVTDPGLAESSMVRDAAQQCRDADLNCDIFSAIKGNPTGSNIEAGVTHFRQGEHDGVIAFGGGSALDAGKAIALMSGQKQSLWAFEDEGDNWQKVDVQGIAPIIAVPTTAGTGSEVGRASVIIDEASEVKKIIFHPKMLPGIVILDPQLTVSLPKTLTAATGMDALSHNLEALCAPGYHPMANGIAMEGIRLIKHNLEDACRDGSNLNARLNMLVASSMGATAFQKGLGAMHALAHPLGALYDAHHGLLNAVLMPYVLVVNKTAIEPTIADLAQFIGLPNPSFNSFLDWVITLRADIGIPHTLAEIGIDGDQLQRVAEMAVLDSTAGSNPIIFSIEEYHTLVSNALNGNL